MAVGQHYLTYHGSAKVKKGFFDFGLFESKLEILDGLHQTDELPSPQRRPMLFIWLSGQLEPY